MTEEEYQKMQREREEYRKFVTQRHNQLIRESLRLEREKQINNYRLCNPTKTDEELKIDQTFFGSDMMLKNYDYVTKMQSSRKKSNSLLQRIIKIIKDNFTFDC